MNFSKSIERFREFYPDNKIIKEYQTDTALIWKFLNENHEICLAELFPDDHGFVEYVARS